MELWRETRIIDIGEVVTGTTPTTSQNDFYGGPYKLISPADLDAQKYVSTSHRTLTQKGLEQCRPLPKNAVLVGCIGNIGKIAMTHDEVSATNQQINAIICNKSHDPDFVYYCLMFNRSRLEAAAVKTTVPILNKRNFQNCVIAAPQLAEQRKIAAVLSLVQRAIAQQERLIQLTNELKKALMHKLFTEGTRGEPQKQTEIGPIPQSWQVRPLSDLSKSFQYGSSVKCEYAAQGQPFLRIPNVIDGRIDISELKFGRPKSTEIGNLELEYEDLVFVRTNGVKENAGRCAVYRNELEGPCYYASYLIRVRVRRDRLVAAFLDEYSRTMRGMSFLSGRSIRTADGKFNINIHTLRSMLLPLPCIAEQQNITETALLVNRNQTLQFARHHSLSQLFRTLLHQLMTVQIRVDDLDLRELGVEVGGVEREEAV